MYDYQPTYASAVLSQNAVLSGSGDALLAGFKAANRFEDANRGHRGLGAIKAAAATKATLKAGPAMTDISVNWVSRPRRILLER